MVRSLEFRMADEEEEDQKVRYWRTKYEILYSDYGRTKDRTEGLESRLLELVEENEQREIEKDARIRQLDGDLDEARRRIEQLEAACFRYKNQNKVTATVSASASTNSLTRNDETGVPKKKENKDLKNRNHESDEDLKEDVELDCLKRISASRTSSRDFLHSSVDGITRSPDFHGGVHVICEYHKLPILSKGEGFIYGFRWKQDNKIHVV